MDRVITVKGKGKASLAPDTIVLSFNIETIMLDYDDTMSLAAKKSQELLNAIKSLGFEDEDLKTTSYEIDTKYESYRDKNNDYKTHFVGYRCDQSMLLEFSMDFELLSKVLNVIMRTSIMPRLNIRFTIKDKSAVTDLLLKNATEDALEKARILTEASGTKLGVLVNIDYNWSEISLYSRTSYQMLESEISYSSAPDSEPDPHIVPDDIEVDDTVTFVWEIK